MIRDAHTQAGTARVNWWHAKWVYPPQMVTHPSTNRARCRATTLIETESLQLNHSAILMQCATANSTAQINSRNLVRKNKRKANFNQIKAKIKQPVNTTQAVDISVNLTVCGSVKPSPIAIPLRLTFSGMSRWILDDNAGMYLPAYDWALTDHDNNVINTLTVLL